MAFGEDLYKSEGKCLRNIKKLHENSLKPDADQYERSRIVSLSAYKMQAKGITWNELARVWYKSMSMGLNANSKFDDVRRCVVWAAMKEKLNAQKIAVIKAAFDEVEITKQAKVRLYGVVTDATSADKKLESADVVVYDVNTSGENHFVGKTNTGPQGQYVIELEAGKYTVFFNKKEYERASFDVSIISEDKRLDKRLAPLFSASVSGTVYDASGDVPLAGVTVRVIADYETPSEDVKGLATTNASGEYLIILQKTTQRSTPYAVVASKSGYGQEVIDVVVTGNTSGVFFSLDPEVLRIPVSGDIPIDEAHFPDKGFRIYVRDNFDKYPSDGVLNYEEIRQATSVYLYKYDTDRILPHDAPDISQKKYGTVYSLQGIEYLWALQELRCIFHEITTLDISQNLELKRLDIIGNKLTVIDISENTALRSFSCYSNQLTELDVSKNTMLTELFCGYNQLTTLDVSKNTFLDALGCQGNQLSDLDISRNTVLTTLYCYSNQLTTLDLSKHIALEELECFDNQLVRLDLSQNTSLRVVYCGNNKLTSLNVGKNNALLEIECSNNQLTTLDLSNNTALDKIYCADNQLTTLKLGDNASLTELHCENNHLSNLDISHNTLLMYLYCSDNNLTTLDLRKNKSLSSLECQNNKITLLDLSNCPNIKNRNYVNCDQSVTIVLSNGKTITTSSTPSSVATDNTNVLILLASIPSFTATRTGEYIFDVSIDKEIPEDSRLFLLNESEDLGGIFTSSDKNMNISANFRAGQTYSPVIVARYEDKSQSGGCNAGAFRLMVILLSGLFVKKTSSNR